MYQMKLEFDLDDDVMSLKDMLHECLGLRRKHIHECSIIKTEDSWTSYCVILNKELDEEDIVEEFGSCLSIRNICINGRPIDANADAESTDISDTDSDTTSYSEETETETETETESEDESVDPFQELAALFPMLDIATAAPLDPKIAAALPLLKELLRESRLIIGNSTTGAVAEVTGFGPADGGTSILLYGDF